MKSPARNGYPCAEEASSTVPPFRLGLLLPHAPFVLSCSNSSGAKWPKAVGPRGLLGLAPRLIDPRGVCYGRERRMICGG